ncbi:hypothetical protein ACMYR3_05550 [Ampullimonas aquatilis]|uniref:hypothetical protein n=1 Tax=Ampullimonas aquatilis TaxID=1341549 RepID=UPI003C785E0E
MTIAPAQTFQPAKWLSRLSTSLAGLLLFSSAALAHNVDTSLMQIKAVASEAEVAVQLTMIRLPPSVTIFLNDDSLWLGVRCLNC